jgi:poly(beta-D-mannuronate) lyase
MNNSFVLAIIIDLAILASQCIVGAETPHIVDSLDGLRAAIKKASPGSVIEVSDGVYELERDLELKRLQGKPAAPITIRAQHLLQAEFAGDHIVKLRDSAYLVLEGFRFTLKADVHGKGGALSVRNCQHCRISQNEFELDERDTGKDNQTWLTVDGRRSGHNRVDHNRFSNKTKKGHFIFITGEDDFVSQHDRIEQNHFVDRAYGNDANEYEAIRVGESHIGNRGGKSFTTIRNNLFERCQGEDEIVSFKVGGCSFIGNTVINCHGSIVFRAGNDGVFSQNIMLNTYTQRPFDAYRAGGVRFYGSGHRAMNNYFQGLNGTSMKAPLALMHGAVADSGALGVADGLPATDCQIVHNTWVQCAQLRLGHASKKRPLKPQQCLFMHNIVCETDDSQLLRLFEADGIALRGNILHATGGKETGIQEAEVAEDGIRVIDPKLEKRGEIFRLSPSSPAINASAGTLLSIEKDMDGSLRDEKLDIGADEFVPGTVAERMPLKPVDVGPKKLVSQ